MATASDARCLVIGALASTATFAVVSFAMALGISWLSYRLFEQRVSRFLRGRFTSRPAHATPMVLAMHAEGG